MKECIGGILTLSIISKKRNHTEREAHSTIISKKRNHTEREAHSTIISKKRNHTAPSSPRRGTTQREAHSTIISKKRNHTEGSSQRHDALHPKQDPAFRRPHFFLIVFLLPPPSPTHSSLLATPRMKLKKKHEKSLPRVATRRPDGVSPCWSYYE